jgi:hypothetical protein
MANEAVGFSPEDAVRIADVVAIVERSIRNRLPADRPSRGWQPGIMRGHVTQAIGGRSGSTLGTGKVKLYDLDVETLERSLGDEELDAVNDYPAGIAVDTDVWLAWWKGKLAVAIENCAPEA